MAKRGRQSSASILSARGIALSDETRLQASLHLRHGALVGHS